MAEIAGLPAETFSELYWADRLDYDKGLLSGPEYWHGVARKAGTSLTQDAIEKLTRIDITSWMHFDPVMWEWVTQLRGAGKRVAMLSNMPRELGEALRTETDKLASFNQVTLSYEVRAVKPEPAIYEQCLEGLGTEPETTLFLDDRIANVQGAEFLGIRAIQFTSRDEVLLKVRA
jgi:putative hydrolase of the HAD superfamily